MTSVVVSPCWQLHGRGIRKKVQRSPIQRPGSTHNPSGDAMLPQPSHSNPKDGVSAQPAVHLDKSKSREITPGVIRSELTSV